MLSVDALLDGTRAVLNAAILGQGWEQALDKLSKAAGSRGLALIRNRNRRLVAAITNRNIAEPVADYLAGKAPANSRQLRVDHARRPGFRLDYDDYTAEQIARDPFYQDFLRPIGAFWHANARLEYHPGDELAISFKRDLDRGSYSRSDADRLSLILPELKAAARVAQGVLDATTRGMARVLTRRGDPVFELDTAGRVLRAHGFSEEEAEPIQLRNRKLTARECLDQGKLDHAVATATLLDRPAHLTIGPASRPYHLQFLPISGEGCDVFGSAAAIGVLFRPIQDARPGLLSEDVIRALLLTEREIEVARFLLEGRQLSEIATLLQVQPPTVRFHLRGLFRKTATSRQAELVALLSRLPG